MTMHKVIQHYIQLACGATPKPCTDLRSLSLDDHATPKVNQLAVFGAEGL